MIRKPNEDQFNHLHFHFQNDSYDSPAFLLNSINLKKGGDDEWTMTNLFATYHLLVLGSDLIETRKYFRQKQFALYQITPHSHPHERYLAEKIRMPNDGQLEQFRTHFKSKSTKNTPEKFLAHINLERDSGEPGWSFDNLYSTYELLIMGSKFRKMINGNPSNEYRQAAIEINQFQINRGTARFSDSMDIRNPPATTNHNQFSIISSSTFQFNQSTSPVQHQSQYKN
ncbi:uncharacterized protein LOC128389780 isoform X2 [Panonychus citri]|uniref:uncharacterized protein LOC128389780 isoform X2 n=1 Tax=Panonychus citri TaxID=50023 RepID=UPI00230700BA|nr:uncharacterized protein LOC128389780 isoform X2 [Panonychus citri]